MSRRSVLTYLGLIAYLVAVKIVLGLASITGVVASQEQLFGWPVIVGLAVLGSVSVWLAPRAGLPELWDVRVSARARWLLPALAGGALGALTLLIHELTGFATVLAKAANISTINVAFPGSLLFYSGGAIVLESTYRLILIVFPLWLTSTVVLRGRARTPVFWALALAIAVLEPLTQMSIVSGHPVMPLLGLYMYAINVIEFYLLWRGGFLAPVAFRIGFYLFWHVLGGALGL